VSTSPPERKSKIGMRLSWPMVTWLKSHSYHVCQVKPHRILTPQSLLTLLCSQTVQGAHLMSVGYVLKFEIEWWYVASGMWQVVCGEDGSHSELTVHQALD